MIEGHQVRIHRHQTVTIHVSETTLAIELDDGGTRVVRRTTTVAVRNIKADRPRAVPFSFLAQVSNIWWWTNVAHHLTDNAGHGLADAAVGRSNVALEGAENRRPGQLPRSRRPRLRKWPDMLAVDQLNAD